MIIKRIKEKKQQKSKVSTDSSLIQKALHDELYFSPAPPGMRLNTIEFLKQTIEIDARAEEISEIIERLQHGALSNNEIKKVIERNSLTETLNKQLLDATTGVKSNSIDSLTEVHDLDHLANLAVNIISRIHESLLTIEPLTEIKFQLTDTAKAVLAIGWEAMLKRGIFPLPPLGRRRIQSLLQQPLGAMHFVSASDLDGGYYYTMGIAMSPEAQSLGTIDVSYGLDGELIVPGQAVSPIPPFLAMATRLFSAGMSTSSNISEEVQSIPMRNYPHPTAEKDLAPKRSGIYQPSKQFDTIDQLISDLKQQLWKNRQTPQRNSKENERFIDHGLADLTLPPIKAVFEVTQMTAEDIRYHMKTILKEKELADRRKDIALYLNIESTCKDRISRINAIVDVASEFGFKYVAVADDDKDQWLPNLLEYLEPHELNAVADYSDKKNVIVIDGRPIDPIYTAATSAQRIQSVYTTLAVDVLKMGMWLCLDAVCARIVYRELLSNPHIPKRMLLMPIGIIEPWNAFVDNRDSNRTARAILDPFEKIKFMIEEAKVMGMPSLLTDTRHKETWVLLGRKTNEDEPHPREIFIRDPTNDEIVCRTSDSAIPLLSWQEFMECERLARKAGIFLGQAGSVETTQLFRIISETTYDAAKEGKNPATGIWTAETERVLNTGIKRAGVELQSQRSATVSPFLAIINRGFESHAKLDGWLRYLSERGESNSSSLRESLQKQRREVNQLLQNLLVAQTEWQKNPDTSSKTNYQNAWDQFRKHYLEYHQLIKDNFNRTRDQVAKRWPAQKAASSELQEVYGYDE